MVTNNQNEIVKQSIKKWLLTTKINSETTKLSIQEIETEITSISYTSLVADHRATPKTVAGWKRSRTKIIETNQIM